VIRLTGTDIELRALPESDLAPLLEIYRGTPGYFAGIGDDAVRLGLADVREQWRAARERSGGHMLGVYRPASGPLIGVADVRLGAPRPDAAAVWLLIGGAFQRQGYGQECMALLEQWLITEMGASSLCAAVGSNEEALNFLALQGFQLTDEPAEPPVGAGRAVWACW
jgi:GNAT superfamily N-acetyltransferase